MAPTYSRYCVAGMSSKSEQREPCGGVLLDMLLQAATVIGAHHELVREICRAT